MRLLGSLLENKQPFPLPGITKKENYPWFLTVIFSIFVFTFVGSATQSSMIAGYMAEKMNVSQSAILAADSLRMGATAASLFAANWMYRKLGLRTSLMISSALWTIPHFLFPFLPTVGWLYVFKFLQGLNGFCFPLFLSTILKWAPPRNHGSVSAVFNGFYMSGAFLGSITVLIAEKVQAWYMSSILLGLVALTGWIGIALTAVDKKSPATEAAPVKGLSRKLLAAPATWLMFIAFSACNWVDMAVNTDMPIYAQFLGIPVSASSGMMIIISVSTLISSLVAGKVSDLVAARQEKQVLRRRVLVFSTGFVVAIVGFLFVISARSYPALLTASVVTMVGASWANGTFWAIPPLFFTGDTLETGTSIVTALSNLVCPISTFVVGVLCGGRNAWAAGWMICVFVCVVSMACGLRLIKHKKI